MASVVASSSGRVATVIDRSERDSPAPRIRQGFAAMRSSAMAAFRMLHSRLWAWAPWFGVDGSRVAYQARTNAEVIRVNSVSAEVGFSSAS